jgi:hypothetical protein
MRLNLDPLHQMPLAAAVTDYHNHRAKKLKKQRMA